MQFIQDNHLIFPLFTDLFKFYRYLFSDFKIFSLTYVHKIITLIHYYSIEIMPVKNDKPKYELWRVYKMNEWNSKYRKKTYHYRRFYVLYFLLNKNDFSRFAYINFCCFRDKKLYFLPLHMNESHITQANENLFIIKSS